MTTVSIQSANQQEYARIILDAMYQFLGLLDVHGSVLEINKAALDGAGITLDHVIGKPFWETHWWDVSAENRTQVRDMVQQAAQGHFMRCDIEVYGDQSGQKKIFVDFSLTPIRDKNGQVIFLLPEGRNITEKIAMETELTRKNKELQSALEKLRELDGYKTNFFANISHELRTPLALILGSIEQLLRHGKNFDERDLFRLKAMRRNAQSLVQEVNDLLDLARIDAQQMPVSYARIDISQLVKNIAATFASAADERSISFQVHGPLSLYADIDQAKFTRIIGNLLSNAFKFTPQGGRILCSIEETGNQECLIRVQDNGPGVPNQQKEQIFARFSQGSDSFSDIGSGIGLNIVKDFVEIQKGSVTLLDAPGGGAIFAISLPLVAPQGEIVRASDQNQVTLIPDTLVELQHPETFQKNRSTDFYPLILLVEDNAGLRRFLHDVLIDDFNIAVAANGNEALHSAMEHMPDLIITDLMMPDLDGEKLIRELRRNPNLSHIPVIVLSARADDRLRETLLDGLVQDYLTKPFSAQELRARIRNLVTVKKTVDLLQKELNSQTSDISQLTTNLIGSKQSLQQSLAALRQSEQRWECLYRNTAVGIALADAEGKILKANPALQKMLGYSETEIIGISFIALTESQLQESTKSNVNGIFEGRIENYTTEKRYKKRDGHFLWANVSASLIPPIGPEGPRLAVIVEDISSRKSAEKKLFTTQGELAQVSRYATMGELVATIAHEVNQPLSAIVTNSRAALRWLSRDQPDYQEVIDALHRVDRDANLASGVIHRIRKFISKSASSIERIDIRLIIEDLKILLQAMLADAGIELKILIEPTLPETYGDQVQIQQVLLNLMVNAIDAMRDQGYGIRTLIITVNYDSIEGLVFSVCDTGPGIPEHLRNKIFDVFFSTKSQGLGMGLAISQSIVENHGGKLRLELPIESGACFVFNIPFLQQ